MRGELKRDRTLTMNFNNSTLTDIKPGGKTLSLRLLLTGSPVRIQTIATWPCFHGKTWVASSSQHLRCYLWHLHSAANR